MFLVEPPRTQYDVHFRLAGVPVRVHPLFWLVTALLAANQDTRPLTVLLWVVAVFISIVVHEFGHAVMIRYFGWRPRIVLYSFGGLAAYEPTWRRTWPQVAISFAGPAAGFILALLVAAGIRLAGHRVVPSFNPPFPLPLRFEGFYTADGKEMAGLNEFIVDMFFVNIFWGLVNLLPIYPLDGGQIAHEVLGKYNPANGRRQSFLLSIFAAGGLAAVMGFKFGDLFAALFFGYLAVMNYQMLQQYDGHFGGRGW